MELASTELEQEILRLPWRAVLVEPLVAVAAADTRPLHLAVAAVPLLGEWSGWMTLRCDLGIVQEIAARTRASDVVRSGDLDEAVRWLANELARALREAIDPAAQLGPATVLEPNEPWTPRWCEPAARLTFASGERTLAVALDERTPVTVRSTGTFASDLDETSMPVRASQADACTPRPPLSKRRMF